MNATATQVLHSLSVNGLMSAPQLSAALGLSIEQTYESLVHLESHGLAYIASVSKRWRNRTAERGRLWGSWEESCPEPEEQHDRPIRQNPAPAD